MSPIDIWGPATWLLIHTLCEQVNEYIYMSFRQSLFNMISIICKNLPCPECSQHATQFLARTNLTNLKTKEEFSNFFYLFHNFVNKRKNKPLFDHSNIIMYKRVNINQVINNFISKFNTKGNMKLLNESFQRKLVIESFKKWIQLSSKAFIQPQINQFPPQLTPQIQINQQNEIILNISEETTKPEIIEPEIIEPESEPESEKEPESEPELEHEITEKEFELEHKITEKEFEQEQEITEQEQEITEPEKEITEPEITEPEQEQEITEPEQKITEPEITEPEINLINEELNKIQKNKKPKKYKKKK